MSDTPPPIFFVAVAAIFALGGFVKGVVGLGLPTIATGLLSLLMPPAQAAALLVVPSLVTNVWQIGGPGTHRPPRRTTPFTDPPRGWGPAEAHKAGLFVAHGGPALVPLALLKRLASLLLGVSTIALGVVLGSRGALPATALAGSALALLPALLGMGAGQWLRLRVRPETFKTIFFCGLLALGAYLTIRSALHPG